MDTALHLLARREHSEFELRRKLGARGFDVDTIERALAECRSQNLVSDARFAEALVHQRRRRGYGPLRIRNDLRERGVGDEWVATFLDMDNPEWLESLREVRAKKFGRQPPGDYREWARQARFLQGRGFSVEMIRQVLGRVET